MNLDYLLDSVINTKEYRLKELVSRIYDLNDIQKYMLAKEMHSRCKNVVIGDTFIQWSLRDLTKKEIKFLESFIEKCDERE